MDKIEKATTIEDLKSAVNEELDSIQHAFFRFLGKMYTVGPYKDMVRKILDSKSTEETERLTAQLKEVMGNHISCLGYAYQDDEVTDTQESKFLKSTHEINSVLDRARPVMRSILSNPAKPQEHQDEEEIKSSHSPGL